MGSEGEILAPNFALEALHETSKLEAYLVIANCSLGISLGYSHEIFRCAKPGKKNISAESKCLGVVILE